MSDKRKLTVLQTTETYKFSIEGTRSSIESINPDSLLRLLTVRLIMTSKDKFETCKDDESIALLVDRLEEYDLLPVFGKETTYYVSKTRVEAFLEHSPKNQSVKVRNIKQLISKNNPISEDETIARYFLLRGEPVFVTKEKKVVGVVTLADLNKTPSKMVFYILISFFERLLINLIKNLSLTENAIEGIIGFPKLWDAKGRYEMARRENLEISLIECLNTSDLIKIACSNPRVRGALNYCSQLEAKESLNRLVDLRNKVMHTGHSIIQNQVQLTKRKDEYERVRQHIDDLTCYLSKGKGMVETDKKYVVNIDFPTRARGKGHRIHLNPYFEGCTLKEKILRHYDPEMDKIPRDGGAVYLTRTEALEYLQGNKKREWLGRIASTFRSCKLCTRLPEWDL